MKKISLNGLKEVLSAKELKEIMAGSSTTCNASSSTCATTACTIDGGYSGHCGWYNIGGTNYCSCISNP